MRKTELILLYHGIGHIFPATVWEWSEPSDDLNMGAVFANHVCTLKSKAFASKKFETVGSLLTPIFRHFGVITDRDRVITDRLTMDQEHLKNATWMKPGLNWVYTDSESHDWILRLPLPALTAITEDVQCLTFQADPSLLRAMPRRRLRAGASSRAPPSVAEDAMVDDDLAGGSLPTLDFPEPPAGYDEDGPAFRRYMVSTMRQMWRMLATAVTCSRPPTQSRRRRRSPTPDPHATVADSDDDESGSF